MSIAWRIIGISYAQKQYEQRSEISHVRQTVIRDPSTPLCTHTVHILCTSYSVFTQLMYADKRYYNTTKEIYWTIITPLIIVLFPDDCMSICLCLVRY